MYTRKRKCDLYLIGTIYASDLLMKPIHFELFCFLSSCAFIFNSVVWYLPIKDNWVYYGLRPGHRQLRGGGVGVWWVFESTFENAQWRKVKQVRPMQFCYLLEEFLDVVFENPQWRKVKHLQPLWLCLFSCRLFQPRYKLRKVDQMQPWRHDTWKSKNLMWHTNNGAP